MASTSDSPADHRRDGLTLDPAWQSRGPDEHALDGQSWWYEYLPARYSKGRMVEPPGVRLSVATPQELGGSVLVFPEDAWDRVVKAIGLSREFQTDDPVVDAAFMLSGYVGDDLTAFFQSQAAHQSLSELFALGFTRVELFEDRIKATCRPWSANMIDSQPPETFVKVAAALLRLRAGLATVPAGRPGVGSQIHHVIASRAPVTWAAVGLIGTGAILLALQTASFLSGAELLIRLGAWSVGAGAAAAILLAAMGRRYAFRGRTVVATLLAVFGLVASASLMSLAWLNEALDTSPAVEHAEVVQSKWVNSGRHPSYHIVTPSWRPDHEREDFSLSQSIWSDAQIGVSRYVVHSRAGYFGVEWLQDEGLH